MRKDHHNDNERNNLLHDLLLNELTYVKYFLMPGIYSMSDVY